MKFTRQLEYNSYAPWHAQYINFKKLKRVIKHQRTAPRSLQERWEEFLCELQQERSKYSEFFVRQLDKTVCECEEVVKAVSQGHGQQSRKLREECLHLFLEITELTNFINLNLEGTRKAAKKFDKFNGSDFQRSVSLDTPAFVHGRAVLQGLGERLTDAYAAAFTGGYRAAAAE
jgi:SPX domain protein involved in polyphosphate accumulation